MPMPQRHADDESREEQVLRIYADDPLEDGDTVLLLDEAVCLEFEQLANEWDEQLRRNLVSVLSQTSQRVLVAVARDRAELLPSDYQLWRELHAELRDTTVELLPIRALPAA